MEKEYFTLTENHIKLIRHMAVDWCHSEFGAPYIDPKKPYGNSGVYEDMAEILGMELFEDHNGEKHISKEQMEKFEKLHKETKTALEVILSTGSFELGKYVADEYNANWKKV